jgi:hypothetical protein
MSAKGDKLRTEKSNLHQLAKDVKALLDDTVTLAQDRKAGDNRWSGPQADRVRGELSTWQGKLATMADNLDAEADKRGRDATAADAAPGK